MLKVLLITIGAVILLMILAFVVFILMISWEARKQPPSFNFVENKYYVCRSHQLLEGGIFRKGPRLKFPANNTKLWCWRDDWEEINKETFKRLATEWYGKDWSNEIPFWADD
ncbi:MAG: hypothetical protein GY781_17050 [Gammaproteobacteria bacterium]|nr:hypothetical protein [Gammaproteobacteria bacterium]